jgi:hypothetical protein
MKKTILSAVAAGALAVGGAASAQDLGTAIGNVLGSVFGAPTYNYGNNGYYGHGTAIPGVVATPSYGYNTTYVDAYGRQVYVDPYGRHIVQQNHNLYGGVTYDAWGRPVYNQSYGTYAYGGNSWDRDGDGIANTRDRWPNDRRYY